MDKGYGKGKRVLRKLVDKDCLKIYNYMAGSFEGQEEHAKLSLEDNFESLNVVHGLLCTDTMK